MADHSEPDAVQHVEEGDTLDFDAARTAQPEPTKEVQVHTPTPSAPSAPVVPEMTTQQLVTWAVLNDKVHLIKEVRDIEVGRQDREAMLEFQRHFSQMQREFVPVQKSRDGQFGPYANINDILAVYSPILTMHGFSATFEEEELPGKIGWKRVWSIVMGYGHTKKTYFDCPPAPENKGSSAIQKEAGNTTYGKRQAFISNVGVVLQDEDKDGDLTFEAGVALAQEISLIRDSSKEELRDNYRVAIQNKTPEQIKVLDAIKKKRVADIQRQENGARS